MAEARWGSFKWGELKWGEGLSPTDAQVSLDAVDSRRIAYLFVIEGLADCWVWGFHADITASLLGSGGGSWIGTAYGARRVRAGLDLPDRLFTEETSPTDGMLRESGAEYALLDDETDYLAALFKTEWDGSELTRLGERLPPSKTPVDATMKKWDGIGTVSTRDAHIGNEYIDSNGLRRALYVTPSNPPPGLDHPVAGSVQSAQLPPVYVSSSPHNWAGREFALYRLVYDDEAGAWPSWKAHYDSGRSLIWYGRLTGRARYAGSRRFVLKLSGASSHLDKLLGLHMVTPRLPINVGITLSTDPGNDQTQLCILPYRRGYGTANSPEWYTYNFDSANAFDASETTSSIAERIQAALQTALTNTSTTVGGTTVNSATNSTVGMDGNYEDAVVGIEDVGPNQSEAHFDPHDGRSAWITIGDNTVGTDGAYAGVILIGAHIRVWASLGWDPIGQAGAGDLSPDNQIVAFLKGFTPWDKPRGHGPDVVEPPAAGYYWLILRTEQEDAQVWQDVDNDGNQVFFKAAEPVSLALYPEAKQRVTFAQSFLYFEGQRARPFADSVTINGTQVDSAGWFLFEGKLRHPDGDDVVDYQQVGYCSWVPETDGTVRQNANGQPELYVEYWEDPRHFGLKWRRLGDPDPLLRVNGVDQKILVWVSHGGTITARRLIVLSGHRPGTPEFAWRVAPRMMVSSGTSGAWSWSGGNEVKPSVGSNDPAGDNDYWSSDLEIQDLGLNKQGEWVDFTSFAEQAGIGVEDNSPLNRYRLSTLRPVRAMDALQSIMQQRAWSMSWKQATNGPQFGVFSPFEWISPESIDVTLTESDIAGRAGDAKSWTIDEEIGWEAPIDVFKTLAGFDPVEDGTTFSVEQKSWDPWGRGRRGNVKHSFEAPGLVDPRRFTNAGWADWIGAWRTLHTRSRAEWQSETHMVVRTRRLAGSGANLLYPGATVSLTDQRVLAPDGTYGVTSHVGRVLSASHYTNGEAEATILLQARQTSAFRYWSAVAEVTGYDTAAETLTLSQNTASHTIDNQVDADGFAEPSWSSQAGTAKFRIIQGEDGDTWATGEDVTGDVVSVAGNVLTYTNLTGTLRPDTKKWIVLQSATDHATTDWPYTVYAVTTDVTGDFSGNQAKELY